MMSFFDRSIRDDIDILYFADGLFASSIFAWRASFFHGNIPPRRRRMSIDEFYLVQIPLPC